VYKTKSNNCQNKNTTKKYYSKHTINKVCETNEFNLMMTIITKIRLLQYSQSLAMPIDRSITQMLTVNFVKINRS